MKTRTSSYRNRNQNAASRQKRGYVSLLVVFTMAIFMLSMLLFAYQRAINSQSVQADIQAQTDYREKEETILRSIVAITPNRAILAMQDGSFSDPDEETNPLSFRNIFSDALAQANARQSISDDLRAQLAIPNSFSGNTGDSALDNLDLMFQSEDNNDGFVTGGLNRDLGVAFPPALDSNNIIVADDLFPIISKAKKYGNRANGQVGLPTATYSDFNVIPYPDINFGYAQPGQNFVAKRNWWAFSMNLAESDNDLTSLARFRRDFVLSIYEIPSQLPISASSYMALGAHADGSAWQNVTISGNVFAGRAVVEGNTALPTLATRRGATLSANSTIGGQSFTGNPFAPGVRETFRLTQGDFFPISLASESGKAAFISINRGVDYFDRYAHTAETNTVSQTTWNEYSVGALQCAMRLDITQCTSVSDRKPTELQFSYMRNGTRQVLVLPQDQGAATNLEAGYIYAAPEGSSVNFNTPVDVAYGAGGSYFYRSGVSGSVLFSNDNFGNPIVGTPKNGYFRPRFPFEVKNLSNGKICVAVYPERFAIFMNLIGADSLAVNNSLAINVDYVNSANLTKPLIPSTSTDYGVILQECADLTSFTKGFSLVTNLRLHIGDDFNDVATTPPTGYTPPNGAAFYPPTSLFAPEKRYGADLDPLAVEFSGRVGSVASETAATPIRPLDTTTVSGISMSGSQTSMNLSTIRHPAELPPIFMMNWLIVLEEKRSEFY